MYSDTTYSTILHITFTETGKWVIIVCVSPSNYLYMPIIWYNIAYRDNTNIAPDVHQTLTQDHIVPILADCNGDVHTP